MVGSEVLNLEEEEGRNFTEFHGVELGSDLIRCLTPVKLKSGLVVPCGHCSLCLNRRKTYWALRAYLDSSEYLKIGLQSFLITLTYDEEHLPDNLEKKPLQDFIKRFRHCFDNRFKYVACGEYGEKFGRPHYHILGLGLSDNVVNVQDNVSKCWQFGFSKVSPVNFQRCAYVAKYCLKAITSPFVVDKDLELTEFKRGSVSYLTGGNKEFFCMSRRPGVGSLYYENHKEILNKNMFVSSGGHKYSLPRYFRSRLSVDFPDFKDRYLQYCLSLQKDEFLKTGLDYLSYREYFLQTVQQSDINIKSKLNFFRGGFL